MLTPGATRRYRHQEPQQVLNRKVHRPAALGSGGRGLEHGERSRRRLGIRCGEASVRSSGARPSATRRFSDRSGAERAIEHTDVHDRTPVAQDTNERLDIATGELSLTDDCICASPSSPARSPSSHAGVWRALTRPGVTPLRYESGKNDGHFATWLASIGIGDCGDEQPGLCHRSGRRGSRTRTW
jgi:hypothetical protein